MSTLREKAKANPMMTSIIMFVTLASGVSAAWNAGEWIDSVHTTEIELAASHPVSALEFSGLNERIDLAQVVNQCRWLKSEIRALKDSIYRITRDVGDPDYINALSNDLEEMEDEYDVLSCARLLS